MLMGHKLLPSEGDGSVLAQVRSQMQQAAESTAGSAAMPVN